MYVRGTYAFGLNGFPGARLGWFSFPRPNPLWRYLFASRPEEVLATGVVILPCIRVKSPAPSVLLLLAVVDLMEGDAIVVYCVPRPASPSVRFLF